MKCSSISMSVTFACAAHRSRKPGPRGSSRPRTNAASPAVPVTVRAMNANPRTSKTNAATKGTLEKLRSTGSSGRVANVKDSQAPPTAPSRSTTNSTSALARLPIAKSAYAIHRSAWKYGVLGIPYPGSCIAPAQQPGAALPSSLPQNYHSHVAGGGGECGLSAVHACSGGAYRGEVAGYRGSSRILGRA